MDAFSTSENAPTSRGLMADERVLGRYRLVRRLGRGGMGDVWLAHDESLACEVALKFLPDAVRWDPAALAALKEETRRARQLAHPHIVRIHDFVEDDSYAAISMEYIDGRSLAAERLARPTQVLSPADIMAWLPQLAAALDYAHREARVVHRDLKPANVLLGKDGQVKLSDFGVARTLGESMLRVSQFHTTGGTLLYMSPQQHFGEAATPADDIYALGATLYELLTGKPPFHTGNVAAQIERRAPDGIAVRRRQLGVDAAEEIPASWEKAIAACLAKRPEERPASAGEVATRLAETSTDRPKTVVTYYVTSVLRASGRRMVLLGVLAVTLVVAAWVYWPGVVVANGLSGNSVGPDLGQAEAASAVPVAPDRLAQGRALQETVTAVAKSAAGGFASDATRAVAAWNLDGDGQDASGRGLALSAAGVVPAVDRHGRPDRAMHLNGNAHLMSMESTLLGGDGLQRFTATLWVRPTSEAGMDATLLKLRPLRQDEPYWSLGLNGGHPLASVGRIHEDNPDEARSARPLVIGQWSHVAWVGDEREIRVYLNGELTAKVARQRARALPSSSSAQLLVGHGDRLDPAKFVGDLDQIRLWRRSLTEAEIVAEAVPAVAPQFVLTGGTYADKDDLAAAITREWGGDARLADWEEVRRWHRDDVESFADELGIKVDSVAAYVQRAGQRRADEKRHYFITRFDGQKPGYFLAHEELGGMGLALGSWYGNLMPALVAQPLVAPTMETLTAQPEGLIKRAFSAATPVRALALAWEQEFSPTSGSGQALRVELRTRDGRSYGLTFCGPEEGRFALSVGESVRPQVSRQVGANYARLRFTVTMRAGRLHGRAVTVAGGAPVFQETVALAEFNPADLAELRVGGVPAVELTTER